MTMETLLVAHVAKHRDDLKDYPAAQVVVDILWSVWAGMYDQEIENLTAQDLQNTGGQFLWHRHCMDSRAALSWA